MPKSFSLLKGHRPVRSKHFCAALVSSLVTASRVMGVANESATLHIAAISFLVGLCSSAFSCLK
jgi:hypothetical protein